jgi:hypothetical protein
MLLAPCTVQNLFVQNHTSVVEKMLNMRLQVEYDILYTSCIADDHITIAEDKEDLI